MKGSHDLHGHQDVKIMYKFEFLDSFGKCRVLQHRPTHLYDNSWEEGEALISAIHGSKWHWEMGAVNGGYGINSNKMVTSGAVGKNK